MGKKVKKRAVRSVQKEKRVTSSAKTASQESIPITETVGDRVSDVKEVKVCPHLDKGIVLEKISSKMASVEAHKCDDCREGAADRRASKGKGKNSKKKGGISKSESKSIWVCLQCGHFSCGGVGFPTTPQSHAGRHAKQNRHPLAVQFSNPNLRWCFLCDTLIPVQSPDENGEVKDVFSDIVKVLKAQSSSGPSADAEDVWFGSGSVTSEIKAINALSSSPDNGGGYMARGLKNLGNTCFFNSVLQNLLAMDKLRDYFLRLEGPVGPLTVSLKKLFVETNPSTGARNVIDPRTFLGCVCTKAPQFSGYQQHDSHELLRFLLDGLRTEESGVCKRVQSDEDNTVPKHASTFVDAMFGGQISSTVSCLECGYASIVYEPYLDLSLPLPTKRSTSKRTPSVSRSKKPKLPPKRQGKLRTKTYRASASSPATSAPDIPTSDRSSIPLEPVEALAEEKVAPVGDSTQAKYAVLGGMGNNSDSFLQKQLQTQGNGIEQIFEGTNKASAILSDNLAQLDYVEPATMSNIDDKSTVESSLLPTWSDYLGPTTVSNDHFPVSTSGFSATEYTGNQQLLQNEELLQHTWEVKKQAVSVGLEVTPPLPEDLTWLDYVEPSTSSNDHDVASCNNYLSAIPDSANSNVPPEDEPQLKVEESEALLLPYTEFTSTSGNEVTSSVNCEQEPLDFDGFGGLFDEPEVAAGPPAKPLSDGVAESGFMATNTSESDPDEMDNTDSPVSVEKCLAYFTTPELLTRTEHAWQCEQCSKLMLEQKMRLKNKLHKPVLGGGENIIPSAPSGSVVECSFPKGVENLNNGAIDRALLGISDENSVLQNGNSDSNRVVPELEEGKTEVNCASARPSQCPSSVKALSGDGCTIQDTESCGIDEASDKTKNEKDQKRESKLLSKQHESDGTEDDEVDSKCVKVARDASKRILINRAPQILTIHLKRFRQDARGHLSKLNGHVDFRNTIDLKPYMDPSCCRDRGTYKYRLIGVVEHQGTMRGGHYVAYVRGGAKKRTAGMEENEDYMWYNASDAHVREASLEEVLRCEAYILFYEEM